MRDAHALRRTLEVLLATVAIGCTREEPAAPAIARDPERPKVPPLTASASAAPQVASITASPLGHAGCFAPSKCLRAADAAAVAISGATTMLGCPSSLDPDKAKVLGSYFISANLDESHTTATRKDAAHAGECCYSVRRPCMGGRPLTDDGVALLAPIREGASWCAPLTGQVDRADGEAWLADARMEHASVASFARASLELLAIGAPGELVAECHRAALDEIEHARLCFAMAARCLGESFEPGPLPIPAPRACTVVDVARTTVLEGCLAETTAVLLAARKPANSVAREVLDRIVADETAHAALAFRIVRFCLERGGPEVARAVAALDPDVDGVEREAWTIIVQPLLRRLATELA
jgi:hypothetical protein